MSAILGVYHPDGRTADPSDLERMADVLAHRGPDGRALWHEGSVGLGHLLLRTTSESTNERQPLSSEAGAVVLTADLRLDNRESLAAELGLGASPSETLPDARLLLAAYQRWGEDCPHRLLGDFAFVVWDREQGRLFAARDPMGVKPLFWTWDPGWGFAFATAIPALCALPRVGRALDGAGVALHLTLPVVDDPASTLLQAVRALPAGHALEVARQGPVTRAWWSLDPTVQHAPASDQEYATAFATLFEDAVRVRLRTHRPVAAMLSGGLDSSSIVSVASRLRGPQGERLITLSAVYDEVQASDERPFIEAVLDRWPAEASFLRADRMSPLADGGQAMALFGQPNPGPNLYLSWGLYPHAHARGARVLLDGFDGDTVVSHGLGAFAEYARHWRLVRLFRELRAWGERNDRSWHSTLRELLLYQTLGTPLEAAGVARLYRWARRRGRPPRPLPLSRDPDYASMLAPAFAECLEPYRAPLRVPVRSERDHHFRLLVRPVLPRTLELLDAVDGAFQLEPRYPYMDRRLVEFCLSLPADQKVRDGWTRSITRRALQGVLPDAVAQRVGKADLAHGFLHSLRAFEMPTLERFVGADLGGISRYVQREWIRRVYDDWLAGRASYNDMVRFWRVLTLALWLEARE